MWSIAYEMSLFYLGADAESDVISQYVKVVESDDSDSCPVCLGMPEPLTVELTRCRHRLHLACLNAMLSCQQPPMYIQCPVCRLIYGEKRGNQPPGTMNWTRIPRALPGFPNTNTIQITYEWVRYKSIFSLLYLFNE